MKQALSEALARFADNDNLSVRVWRDPKVLGDDVRLFAAAARLVERLLLGVCTDCGGRVEKSEDLDYLRANWLHCSSCDGSGRVWDEGIVEAVAKAVGEDFLYLDPNNEGNWMGPGEQAARQVAIVALSALVELLTEKVET